MDGFKFGNVLNKYKKCPTCGCNYKNKDFQVEMVEAVFKFNCKKCGWKKNVDENNNEA